MATASFSWRCAIFPNGFTTKMTIVIHRNSVVTEVCGSKKQGNKSMKRDIENKSDIETFVNGFYGKVRGDELLAPVFDAKIPDTAWPEHLQRLYAFWNAILFAETGFEGNPMQKHLTLPIGREHFDRWLALFTMTIDENFAGAKSEEAKKRAASIAGIMNYKIESLR